MRIIYLKGNSPAGPKDAMMYAVTGLPGVHDELGDYAKKARVRAKERLAQHRHDGDSRIELEEGKVDWTLSLNDEAGQLAAAAIEYGRRGADGLYIIRRAMGAM